jgi:hypothetical protein
LINGSFYLLPGSLPERNWPEEEKKSRQNRMTEKLSGSLWGQSEHRTNPWLHPDVGNDISEIENISIRA